MSNSSQEMKPYQQVPIQDCGELLIAIPEQFAFETPHPYQKLGAPYSHCKVDSPYYLRQGVLERLIKAQTQLQTHYPNWKILIFDAYRPIAVQQFMVDYAFAERVKEKGLNLPELSEIQRKETLEEVYQFWALPSLDPATPPPHSTGAALDVTLVDHLGTPLNMGSPIDEISPRSYPNHFAESSDLIEQTYHQNRQILASVMNWAGFQQHPNEWWHFSFGDQLWAWLLNQQQNTNRMTAFYGRYE